jgi:hypothetical protein
MISSHAEKMCSGREPTTERNYIFTFFHMESSSQRPSLSYIYASVLLSAILFDSMLRYERTLCSNALISLGWYGARSIVSFIDIQNNCTSHPSILPVQYIERSHGIHYIHTFHHNIMS